MSMICLKPRENEMVKFSSVLKNEMTLYLLIDHRDCRIDSMHNIKEQKMLKNPPNFFTYKYCPLNI